MVDTLLFADDQVIITSSEDDLQRAVFELNNIAAEYNLEISPIKTKVMAYQGKEPLRAKIVLKDRIIEQVMNFNYLGVYVGCNRHKDINIKLQAFQYLCGTLKRTLSRKVRKETLLKFYSVSCSCNFVWLRIMGFK